MSINSALTAQGHVVQLDIFGPLAVTANTNIVSNAMPSTINPFGLNYLACFSQSGGQASPGATAFVVYISVDSAASLIVTRLQTSTNNTITETFPVETANQPNWHSFEVSMYEQINLQMSANCNILKLTLWEPIPV